MRFLADQVQAAVFTLAAACGSTALVGSLSEWTMALLGVPLFVALAAVAGIGMVVSYQPHADALRLWVTVLSSMVVACAAAVFSIEYGGWPKGAAAFTAAAVGAGLQVFVPWFIAKGPSVLDRVAQAVLQWLPGGSKGE
jgi:hypothetical protein